MLPFSEPKNAGSPLYGLHKAGAGIVHNIMDGIEAAWPDLMTMAMMLSSELVDVMDFGGKLGGIAGDFINRYEDEFVDPLEKGLKQSQKDVEHWLELYEEARLAGDPELTARFLHGLEIAQGQLTEKTREYEAAQARILAIEKQRADLDFLQSQMDLLDLIAEHGLDPAAILGGMELGLDASLEDLLDALTAAMQEIIIAAEGELGISSPSKEFQRIGEQAMAGMTTGIERMMGLPIAASAIASQQMIDNSRSVTIQAGGNTISNGMDQAAFESGIRRIVTDALRG
jgi:hypothetical protein